MFVISVMLVVHGGKCNFKRKVERRSYIRDVIHKLNNNSSLTNLLLKIIDQCL